MGRISFQKRQKEMKRQEKRQMKAEKRAQRKLEKNDPSFVSTNGEIVEAVESVETPEVSDHAV
jgi:NTP pyrophosphatase (non-canonical NTP hydrolase)